MLLSRLTSLYPGWRVMAGAFVSAALAIGFTTYIYGMFVVPVSKEFGISRANANNGMIMFLLSMALVAPFTGQLLDRFSARKVMTVGGLCLGGALMAASQAQSLWLMLVLIGVPLTFGAAACGVLGANTVVVRWFERRRGRALGILALCTSVGGFFAQPLAALLIDAFGWRHALFLLGLIATTTILLLNAFVIRNRPNARETGYDAEFDTEPVKVSQSTRPEEAAPPPGRVWTNRELMCNRNFWLMSLGIGLLFGIDQAVLVSQVPYFQDIGYDLPTTALLVSVKTISAIGGKLVVGYLADKVDLRLLFAYVASCSALLMGVYILQPSFVVLLSCVALLGVAVGGVFPVWTTLMAWLFGARSYGTVMGLMMIIMQPFAVMALRFIGEVYDRSGSYIPAFGIFIGLVITAIVLIRLIRLDDHTAAAGAEASPSPRAEAAP